MMLNAATTTRMEMTSGTMLCCSSTQAKRPRYTSSMARANTGGPISSPMVAAISRERPRSVSVRSMRVAWSGAKANRLRVSSIGA